MTEIFVPGSSTPSVDDEDDDTNTPVPMVVKEAVDSYDSKDLEIEEQLDNLHNRAVEAYEAMIIASQTMIDKKNAPRSAEVAAAFLQIALNAVKEKNSTKDRKDKIELSTRKGAAPTTVHQTTTNNVVMDRETAIRLAREKRGV
jgi:hypothetical protein